MFTHAIVRKPGRDFDQGLTTANLGAPLYSEMVSQHQAYVEALTCAGLHVLILDPLPGCPDAHFVEDTAVVVPEIAVTTNPGALSRKGEVPSIRSLLSQYRPIQAIQPPGTLDGGDVLLVGTQVFIGISDRTNSIGAEQLVRILEGFGYAWTTIPVSGGLHLKSSVNCVGAQTLIITPEFAEISAFDQYRKIVVDPHERYAANTLWLNDYLLMPRGFPKTRRGLTQLNVTIIELDVSEVCKMDGGLTCLSIRF
jgi:dimethylargininase